MKTLTILSLFGIAVFVSGPTSLTAQTPECTGRCIDGGTCPSGNHRDVDNPKTWLIPSGEAHEDCTPMPCLPEHEGVCEAMATMAAMDGPVPPDEDLVLLAEYQSLQGEQLYRIVRRWQGRVYYNSERRAIQQLDCDDRSTVVRHLPLTTEQQMGYYTALAAAAELTQKRSTTAG